MLVVPVPDPGPEAPFQETALTGRPSRKSCGRKCCWRLEGGRIGSGFGISSQTSAAARQSWTSHLPRMWGRGVGLERVEEEVQSEMSEAELQEHGLREEGERLEVVPLLHRPRRL